MFLRVFAAIVLIAVQSATPTRAGAPPDVIFVCEHGAAKSVIATAYFNKIAADRHLPYRAAFRGVNPQDDLSVRAIEGLKADGITVSVGSSWRRPATHWQTCHH